MIHYQLRCGAAHEFDGWFKDSTAFEQQAERHLVACPHCADTYVTRALMAPGIPRKSRPEAIPVASAPASAAPVTGGVVPDAVRAALAKLRSEVEKNCDYVGQNFADEARRIHHGEVEARAIYGESSPEQAEALADEGISIARIPWLPRADS